jgi:hypothetical protein
MPLFGVGFKPKTDDKGNELTQKEVNKVVLNQLIIKKDKRGKRFFSFPLLSTAPLGEIFFSTGSPFASNIVYHS